MQHRYEPILSVDDSWMVFDVLTGNPAERDGRVLIGLAAAECGELARHMNSAEQETARREAAPREGAEGAIHAEQVAARDLEELAGFCNTLADDRERYVRPPQPFAMPAHWEWAIQQALADYDASHVTYLTDRMMFRKGALREVRRVLRPDGRLIFVEHGRAHDAGVVRWQDRLTPVWRRVAGGCHLNRAIDELLARGGFAIAELDRGYIPGPRVGTFLYRGIAHPAASL